MTDKAAGVGPVDGGVRPLAEEARACARHCKEGAWAPNVLQNEQGLRLKSAQLLDAAADEIERLRADRDLEKKWRKDADEQREELISAAVAAERDRCRRAVQACCGDSIIEAGLLEAIDCGEQWRALCDGTWCGDHEA